MFDDDLCRLLYTKKRVLLCLEQIRKKELAKVKKQPVKIKTTVVAMPLLFVPKKQVRI